MKCVENTGLATEIQKLKETIRTNEAALNAALEQLENVKRTTQIQVESAKTTAADSVQREKILMDELKRLSNADANTQKQLVIDYFVKFISDMLTNIGGLVGRNISISPKTKLNELKNHEQELLAIIKDMTTKLPGYSTRVTTASARLAKIILDLESDLTAAKSVKNPDESRYGLTEISEKIKKIKEDEKVALGEFSNSDKKAALARIEQAVIRELGIKK
jgi:outer membrane murein-binding lipoprotein Lpp